MMKKKPWLQGFLRLGFAILFNWKVPKAQTWAQLLKLSERIQLVVSSSQLIMQTKTVRALFIHDLS